MSDTEQTLFDLPTTPQQFSLLLPPSELRKIDFSALEFATSRRAVIEYIQTYFPNDFNDFVSNNGIMMLVELLSYLTAVLSLRGDLLANEAFLPTSLTEDAVINHLALINQTITRATPAVTDVECSVNSPVGSDIRIAAGQQFTIQGENTPITYEIFRSPNDLTSSIIIPANKKGVVAYGVEGKTEQTIITSDGSASQIITVNTNINVIDQPIKVEVDVGGIIEEWNRIDTIERASAQDKVYEVRFFDKRVEFVFGDNVNGMIPVNGAQITFTYRLGGGSQGRIGAGIINTQKSATPDYPYTAPVSVLFRNISPSSGGIDRESIEQAKIRAPRDFATHGTAITESDYTEIIKSFNHPIFGSVAKAVATIRTGLNANLVELYVLAQGPDGPIAPNDGLKRAIRSHIDEINVLTDHTEVLDAKIKAVDIIMTVVMSRSADASIIKSKVEQAISDFFNIRNFDLGQPLYLSQLYDVINQIDGVKYVDIFKPVDNILATGSFNIPDGVNIDELITLGNKQISYYYEAAR